LENAKRNREDYDRIGQLGVVGEVQEPARSENFSKEQDRIEENLRVEVYYGVLSTRLKEDLSEELKGLNEKERELEMIRKLEVVGDFAGKTGGEGVAGGKQRVRGELKGGMGLGVHVWGVSELFMFYSEFIENK